MTAKCRYHDLQLERVDAEGRKPTWALAPSDADRLQVLHVEIHACPQCGYAEIFSKGVEKA